MKKIFTSELLPNLKLLFNCKGRKYRTLFIVVSFFFLNNLLYSQSLSNNNYKWECIGPPGGSRVQALAINPQKPETVFAGTYDGFVFKSTDGGLTSELIDSTFPRRNVPVISPLNPDLMIVGFYRTMDGGVSWDSMSTSGWSYAFHPFNENIIYAVNGYINNVPGQNLIVSYNKGLDWDTLTTFGDQAIHNVKSSKSLPNVLFLSIRGGNSLLKSSDSGVSWDTILTVPNSVIGIFDNSGYNQDYIYVLTANDNFYKSSDGGVDWEQRTSPPSTSVNAMVIDPQRPDTIYFASGDYLYGSGGSVLKSTNGGSSWSQINSGLPDAANRFLYSLAINPTFPENLYVGTMGWGVYKTINGGENWEWTNLTKAPVFSIYIDNYNPDIIYACTIGGGGVYRTLDGGSVWHPLNLNVPQTVLTPFYKITFDPNNDNLAYIASQYGLHKSTDGGISWNLTSLQGSDDHAVYEVAVQPGNSDTIFAGTVGWLGPKDLFRSTDQANTWTDLNLTNSEEGIVKILFDPVNQDIIYVGALTKGIYKSINRGLTWQTINNGLKITDPPLITSVNSIDIDESNPNILYSDNGGVVKTTNGGAKWFRIDSTLFELEPNAVVSRITYINEKVYVSSKNYIPGNNTYYSDGGLYVTSDDGLLWEKIGHFQIYSEVGEIRNNPLNSNEIFLSTMTGIYKGVDTVTSVEEINDNIPNYTLLYQNYPNPFNSSTKISFTVKQNKLVTIKIYNILGKEVAAVIKQTFNSGTHTVRWDGRDYNSINLPSGIYFYRLETEDYYKTKKLVILR